MRKAIRQYGHMSFTQPAALTVADCRRAPMGEATVILVCENRCRNIVENLRMCRFCINTQSLHTLIRKTFWKAMSCVLFSSLRKARFPSFYSLLTLTAMLISVSESARRLSAQVAAGFCLPFLCCVLPLLSCAMLVDTSISDMTGCLSWVTGAIA